MLCKFLKLLLCDDGDDDDDWILPTLQAMVLLLECVELEAVAECPRTLRCIYWRIVGIPDLRAKKRNV